MKAAPTQQEVKAFISSLVPRGVVKQIARLMGVAESDISRRFNPNDERKLSTAEALREQRALFLACPNEFQALRAFIESLWDEWETEGRLPVPSAAQVAKEQHDYLTAELQDAPPCRKGMVLARSIAFSKRRLMYLESGSVGIRKVS